MTRLLVDGVDITAIVPRYSNRLIHEDSFARLLSRKRLSVAELCQESGVTQKSLWRFRRHQRVLPVAAGWRMTSALHCRIGDFTVQVANAHSVARIQTIIWEARELSAQERTELVVSLSGGSNG
ncbi:hypothetical protein [Streptomyces sp. CBMA29]|uniref:hypothetical protein n=1 Tax=Streptomyces sp. CBMA29 TaxID=1896314 RepID=UPI00166209A7|nr:hypothetical protein [Streptomyces sp. CBMA29]MBD0734086.1 hypothetical protein [Streptomyces sp. CBMA29]